MNTINDFTNKRMFCLAIKPATSHDQGDSINQYCHRIYITPFFIKKYKLILGKENFGHICVITKGLKSIVFTIFDLILTDFSNVNIYSFTEKFAMFFWRFFQLLNRFGYGKFYSS